MINHYEPNVKAVIEFLRLLKVKVNDDTVNETLQNHPDWPSMLCITDSLNKWNVLEAQCWHTSLTLQQAQQKKNLSTEDFHFGHKSFVLCINIKAHISGFS